MNTHLLIPFYRKHLYKTHMEYYGRQNIIYHPICDEVDFEPFVNNELEWVKPFICPALKPKEQCYTKFNYFIDAGDIVDDDYYSFCGDDDMFEEGFFDNLKTKTADIVYNSNYRGDKIPMDGTAPHPTYPLIPKSPSDIRPGNVGLGMFSVRGRILKLVRFGTTCGFDDGRLAQKLLTVGCVEYNPDWFILGNFLQPGRHTDPAKFIKPSWTLPQIVL